VKELIEFVAKKLVAHPEDVEVQLIETETSREFKLRVHAEDMGRVIGKAGRTAKAIRTLLGSASAKSGVHTSLEIVE
jgi:uncharacterized protein